MNTAMLSGQLDIISNLTVPQAIEQFADETAYTVHEGTTDGEVVLGFNHRTPALQDLRVRQAINHAIDREALIDAAWGGKGTLIGSMVPPTDPWYEDLSDTYPYDPEKAKALLAEAGMASGLSLRLRVPNLPYGPPAGRFIAAQLEEVGIDVVLDELEFPARWLDLVYTKFDYDMTIVAHVEPRDLEAFANPDYYWGYDNPEFQRLIEEADAGSPEEQVTKLQEAARLLADDAAADWLFLLPNIIVTTPDISGIQANQVSLAFDLTTIAARS
jgi:peptide/nickel transport system substrate-binding protein